MRTLGIDPSLTSTGLAVIRNGRLVAVESIKSKGKKGDGYPEHLVRIETLAGKVERFIEDHRRIDLAVMEAPSYGSRFGSAHERAGLWWRIYGLLVERCVPVATVAPRTRAKYIAGNGNAGKGVVVAHAIERYVHADTPRISNDDEADAVGLAAMGARRVGEPVEKLELPEANLAAMEAVLWPTT